MGNVEIKFKEFIYIYNLTRFELIRMNIKVMGNVGIKKKFQFSA